MSYFQHPAGSKILVVDDEVAILQTLRYNLEKHGYKVFTAGDGRQAISVVEAEKPDLIVLDVMLPVLDGIEACREIRKRSDAPVLMLTARDQEIDKVVALELGADDFITKPFSVYELLARIKAHLRRQTRSKHARETLRANGIELDPEGQHVTRQGHPVELSPKEFGILHALIESKGRVVTRQALLDRVWGYDYDGNEQTVNVHIRWLREKIEDDPNDPKHIITVRSRGYLFRE